MPANCRDGVGGLTRAGNPLGSKPEVRDIVMAVCQLPELPGRAAQTRPPVGRAYREVWFHRRASHMASDGTRKKSRPDDANLARRAFFAGLSGVRRPISASLKPLHWQRNDSANWPNSTSNVGRRGGPTIQQNNLVATRNSEACRGRRMRSLACWRRLVFRLVYARVPARAPQSTLHTGFTVRGSGACSGDPAP